MKLSEYAAQHANDGKKIEAKTYVAASTMVGETFEVIEFARIEKTKYGNPAYIIKISDDTAFFTTASLTRQIDKWIAAGVDDITGARLAIEKHHIDAKDSKDGKEADYLQFAIMDEEASSNKLPSI